MVVSNFLGKQLACDCGQSKCHAAVLDELICELVTSGAMTNEWWEFSAAQSSPDGSGAPLWNASSPSSVYNKTQLAWPESWTVLCIEMRSFQCRCFWTGRLAWDVAWSLDTNLNPDFQLAKPFVFRCGCGFYFWTGELY